MPKYAAEEEDALLTIAEAAAHLGLTVRRVRVAILRRELPAFIPAGRTPTTGGRSGGYRIWRSDVERWYFNIGD